MDALTLLIADHNRVRGLFARFQAAHESEDTAEMAALGAEILTELEVHTAIEEQVFYPACSKASEEIHQVIVEGIEEHGVVKKLAAEVQALSREDEQWEAKMMVIIENVEHHAGEEEEELFPQVRSALGAQALRALGEELESAKARLGAPTAADKAHLSVEELQELAREQEIPGRSKMNRDELVATVAPR